MADAGGGPPNKRQKIQPPALTPSGSESEFNSLLELANELPDELMSTSDNTSAPNGNDTTQHSVVNQPNGPSGGGGGFAGYNRVQGTGHQVPVPTSIYNTNANSNNPSTVVSSMSSTPPHSMPTHNPNTQQVPQTQPVPHTGVPGAPGPQGQTATTQSADPEKRRLVQQQLVLLLHAHKCQRREQNNGEACTLLHCRTMKNVLNHMTTCNAGKSCQAGPQQTNTTTNTGPQSAMNSLGPPAVPPGMNDAQLQKAYAALGLPYNWKQASSLQPNTNKAPVSSQVSLGLNIVGNNTPGQLTGNKNNPLSFGLNTNSPLSGNDCLQIIAQTNRGTKEWHQSVTQDLRNHLVYKLVQAIFPTPDPDALKDRRMNNLVAYARKVEGNMYETANSREEYYYVLAEKTANIMKELEEKRKHRELKKQQLLGDTTGAGIRPQTGVSSIEDEYKQIKDKIQCKICMDSDVEITFTPCGHLVTCEQCGGSMSKCPICRQLIKSHVKTYMS